MPDGTKGCQMVSEGARGYQIMEKSAGGCQRMPDGAKGYQMVSDGSKGCQMVQESTRECQNGPDGANGCQMVPEGGKGCQKDQVGPVVAPGLGEKTDLIFVTVSIAGVEGLPWWIQVPQRPAAGGSGTSNGRTTWEP